MPRTWYGGRLSPGDFVLDGYPAPSQKSLPIFGPYLLWACGQTAAWIKRPLGSTWYGRKRGPRRHCVRWGRSYPLKGTQPPVFGSCLVAKRQDG